MIGCVPVASPNLAATESRPTGTAGSAVFVGRMGLTSLTISGYEWARIDAQAHRNCPWDAQYGPEGSQHILRKKKPPGATISLLEAVSLLTGRQICRV